MKVTETPLTGLPPPSVTVATRGLPKAIPTTALCPLPLVAVIVAGEDAVFVRLKFADDDAPLVDADTMYEPAVVLAVKICEVAMPLAFVASVSVAAAGDVANVPLAPEPGAVKVTDTPLTGDPFDVTVACSAAAKGWPIAALCVVPAVAAMETVGGGVVLPLLLPLQPTNTETRAKIIPKEMD